MRLYIIVIASVLFTGCSVQKQLQPNPEVIAFRFPDKIEQLLLKQIQERPDENYGLLIKHSDNNGKVISLVKTLSFFHLKTSYRALIGEKYYPISFPQFDAKYGVTEDPGEVLKRKIQSRDSTDFLTKKSYPLYHDVYVVKVDYENKILFEGHQ
ncbi:MAG: hypothetical protein AAF489_06690 [Bacteroidota bacterium]